MAFVQVAAYAHQVGALLALLAVVGTVAVGAIVLRAGQGRSRRVVAKGSETVRAVGSYPIAPFVAMSSATAFRMIRSSVGITYERHPLLAEPVLCYLAVGPSEIAVWRFRNLRTPRLIKTLARTDVMGIEVVPGILGLRSLPMIRVTLLDETQLDLVATEQTKMLYDRAKVVAVADTIRTVLAGRNGEPGARGGQTASTAS